MVKQKINNLYALSDSDFAGFSADFESFSHTARFTSGHVVIMNNGVIAWHFGCTTTALCTAMAWTFLLAEVAAKVKYLRAQAIPLVVNANRKKQHK